MNTLRSGHPGEGRDPGPSTQVVQSGVALPYDLDPGLRRGDRVKGAISQAGIQIQLPSRSSPAFHSPTTCTPAFAGMTGTGAATKGPQV